MVLNDGGAGGLSTLRVRSADQALFPPEVGDPADPEIRPEITHQADLQIRHNERAPRFPISSQPSTCVTLEEDPFQHRKIQ